MKLFKIYLGLLGSLELSIRRLPSGPADSFSAQEDRFLVGIFLQKQFESSQNALLHGKNQSGRKSPKRRLPQSNQTWTVLSCRLSTPVGYPRVQRDSDMQQALVNGNLAKAMEKKQLGFYPREKQKQH